ncbi:efflux RND transporter periplasmic adaptor subunit [Hephaestia mangrovi]|uniref:efflux RND transporter periplasmic adaptor subunit n=1 Tax=Hephaestia mangrovi TaxID=2873268 RepID=UPI001CA74336|nr:efflux RND transporter periplasmic adaptor subunit [Hephaestia mangrovi]MBY8826844.1 efflux RND transporter periplasmic adaptor subunit [Hephaestia mangrovi]
MNYEPGQIGDSDRLALPDYEERPRRRRWILGALIVVVVLIAGYLLFGRHDKPAATAAAGDQVPSVSVIVPGRQTVSHLITATGSLAARREMPVGVAGQGGMITKVLVDPGDWVKAGQVLATIDSSVQVQTAASLAAQVKVAESDARLAQANLDRAQKLVSDGFISKADIDQLTATRDAAIAKVHVAQAQLAETRAQNAQLDIRAPSAGLVLTRGAEAGQIVNQTSGGLFRMAKDGEMELDAVLSEADLAQVSVGVPAQVTPVGSSKSYAGHVWQVEPVVDPQTRQGIAKIAIPYNKDLRPGGFATATIHAGASQAPMLPQSAVLSDDKGNYVLIVDADDKVERRDVKTGVVSDSGVAIASGLNGTEHVVRSAGAFLNAGQKVDPKLVKSES